MNAATTNQNPNGRFRDRSVNSVSQSDSGGDFFTRLRNAFFRNRSNNNDTSDEVDQEEDDKKDDDKELTEDERMEREHQKLLRQRLKEKHLKNKRKKRRGGQSPTAEEPDPASTGTTRTWDGGGADANWMTDGNWDTSAPDPGDSLAFGGTTRLTNTNNFTLGNSFFYGLTFNNTAGAFNLSGTGIKLAGPITNNSTNSQTIALPITLRSNVTINAAAGDVVISNPIGGGFGITKSGSSDLTLGASNSYSGGTTLANGELIVNSNGALGSGPLTITSAGGTTTLRTDVDNTTLNNQLVFQGASANLTVGAGPSAGHFNLNGNVNLNGATRTITGTKNQLELKFAGGISGSAGVNFATSFSSTGDYVAFLYTSPNSYTGLTTIKNGAFLVLLGSTANGAIKGDVLIEGNGVLDYLGGASEQVADNATVTVNSTGNSAGATAFGGFDLYNVHGTETIGSLLGTGAVWLSDSTLRVGSGDFSGVITDGTHGAGFTGGKLTKIGTGTLVLSGNNTYTGVTTVSAGNLQVGVGGVGSTGTGATTVASGATLSGTGTVKGTANTTAHVLNGTLKPGDSAGASRGGLTFDGNLALNTNSQTLLQVNTRTTTAGDFGGNAPGSVGYVTFLNSNVATWNSLSPGGHDNLTVNGTLTLGTNSSGLFAIQDDGYASNAVTGDVFDLVDWNAVTAGSFNAGTNFRSGGLGGGDLLLPDLSPYGLLWDVSLFKTDGILVVVPEPSRAMLALVGFTLLVLRRRRR